MGVRLKDGGGWTVVDASEDRLFLTVVHRLNHAGVSVYLTREEARELARALEDMANSAKEGSNMFGDAKCRAAVEAMDDMSEADYRDMVEQDIEWLRKQPASLYSLHIEAVLRSSLVARIRVMNTSNGSSSGGEEKK